MENIRVEIGEMRKVPYDRLRPFQGNLKDLSEKSYKKLKNQILKHGFSFVIHVWEWKGKLHILDGHQRLRTIQTMVEKEGFRCPDLPCVFVNAKDRKEATEKVLAAASQYGDVNKDGLFELMQERGIQPGEIEDVKFIEFSNQSFIDEFYEEPVVDNDTDDEQVEEHSETKQVTFHGFKCPHCGKTFSEAQKVPAPAPTVVRRKAPVRRGGGEIETLPLLGKKNPR